MRASSPQVYRAQLSAMASGEVVGVPGDASEGVQARLQQGLIQQRFGCPRRQYAHDTTPGYGAKQGIVAVFGSVQSALPRVRRHHRLSRTAGRKLKGSGLRQSRERTEAG